MVERNYVLNDERAGSAQSDLILTVDPEFADLVHPPIQLTGTGDPTEARTQKQVTEREQVRGRWLEQLERRIEAEHCVHPFKVWRCNDSRIIVDGRHDEYQVARELKIPIRWVEYEFASRDEARSFLLMELLGRPNYSNGQRILLALRLTHVFRERAKENQGRRTDLCPNLNKCLVPINSTAELAAIAGVGRTTFNYIKRIWEDSQKPEDQSVLGKARAAELIQALVHDTTSVFSVYRKYQDALAKRNARMTFSRHRAEEEPHEPRHGESTNEESATVEMDDGGMAAPSELKADYANRIICGDHIDVLRQLPDGCASLLLFSPDYNVSGIDYHGKSYCRPHAEHLEALRSLIAESGRILRDGGRLVINIASITHKHAADQEREYNTKIFADIPRLVDELDIGLRYRSHIIWYKRRGFKKHVPKATCASARNPFIVQDHEFILIFSKGSYALEPSIPNAPSDITADEYARYGSSVWEIAPCSPSRGGHPCPYPQVLAERIVKLYTYVGDLVVDPCNGSGSTTAAAAALGRRWFGCDVDQGYCRHARGRTEEAYQQYQKTVRETLPQETARGAGDDEREAA